MSETVGVSDLSLLQVVSEDQLMENLQIRFLHSNIYTCIGDVVVSVNPYQKFDIYDQKVIDSYRGKNIYELAPHVFSVADNAYRSMRDKNLDQCVIITGESGAGKTEASKLVMKYIAAVSSSSSKVDKIKEQLLNSNPCLESFGNAKTTRNDNSSRFGKYMDLQFDFLGEPVGGKVTTYLLEKSRVVHQSEGERNFHVFYQVLRGADKKMLCELHLTGKSEDYSYLTMSKVTTVEGMDDAEEFQGIRKAMNAIGIKQDDQMTLMKVVAAILHIGNVTFDKPEVGTGCVIAPKSVDAVTYAAELLGVPVDVLSASLTSRTMRDTKKVGAADVKVLLESEKAANSRDALAKTLYGRLFNWFVKKLNAAINVPTEERINLIGVLDIYGFEVFQKNGFEQFCINYCNEKLQQLFIELTLKSEQEDYAREGITWTHIDYFNNVIILDLIETKAKGIIALLDEECTRPGDVTDMTFLNKLNQNVIKHAHFDSREKSKSDKTLDPSSFRLKHYAGNVTYSVDGFLEKNTDSLFKDMLYAMNGSSSANVVEMFPENPAAGDFKRPDTLATQFRASMQQLMANLLAKEPHYIRCMKPNNQKIPFEFDNALVLHQCRYLGLIENIRVRQLGYCFRQTYFKFIQRYKMLATETWPQWKGTPTEGVLKIMRTAGLTPEEFACGATKVFIKKPSSVFFLEKRRDEKKELLVSRIRAKWLAHVERKKFLKMKENTIKIQATFRMHAQRKVFKRQMHLMAVMSKMIRGYVARCRYKVLVRKQPKRAAPIIQRAWRNHMRRQMLKNYMKTAITDVGPSWRKVDWPNAMKTTKGASASIKKMYAAQMARRYRASITPEFKIVMDLKLVASDMCYRKKTYAASVSILFKGLCIADKKDLEKANKLFAADKPLCVVQVDKYHQADLSKSAPRALAVTKTSLLVLVDKSFKTKETIALKDLTGVSFSSLSDGFFVIHHSDPKIGDVLYNSSDLIEMVACLHLAYKLQSTKQLATTCVDILPVNFGNKSLTVPVSESADAKEQAVVKQADGSFTIQVPKLA